MFSFEFLEDQYIFQDITAILFRCFGGNPWKSQWCHVFDVFCFFVRVECCLRTNQHHSLFGFIKAAPHVRLSERALYPLYIPSRKTDSYLSFFSHFFGGNQTGKDVASLHDLGVDIYQRNLRLVALWSEVGIFFGLA